MIFDLNYNPHCIIVSGTDSGSLVQWTPDGGHRGEMAGYPLGELIFEAQNMLASLRRNMVDLILATIDDSTPRGREKWTDLSSIKRSGHGAISFQKNHPDSTMSY